MTEKRLTGGILSAFIFVIFAFGLFFFITERQTWPEESISLSASDMKMAPYVSTMWCQSLFLTSTHPFVAYQISDSLSVDEKALSHQSMDMKVRVNNQQMSAHLKYFLLPSSVMEIVTFATEHGGHLYVFKGEAELSECEQAIKEPFYFDDYVKTSNSMSYEDDDDDDDGDSAWSDDTHPSNMCASFLSREIPVHPREEMFFPPDKEGEFSPVRINITSADEYIIAVVNGNPQQLTNLIVLSVRIDRALYSVRKAAEPVNICSLATSCTISLNFLSKDRALVWIPDEPKAGRTTFEVRTQCKPRLGLFAIISVIMSFGIILIALRLVRSRKKTREPLPMLPEDPSERVIASGFNSDRAYVIPLLIGPSSVCSEQQQDVSSESEPPSYDSLYERPPPYSCVKPQEATGSR